MKSVFDVKDEKKVQVHKVYRLARLRVWLVDLVEGSILVQNNLESSLIAEVNEKARQRSYFFRLKGAGQSQNVEVSPKGEILFFSMREDNVL